MRYHRKRREERQRDRKREEEGGRMQSFMKEEVKSPIYVENFETTGERCAT